MTYGMFRPLLFRFDPERAHRLAISSLSVLPATTSAFTTSRIASTIAGLDFSNPVGLAAGFDKNAEVPARMFRFGFGFVEVGTVTPRPQSGNDRPRMFRLEEDEGVINRLGFNNDGHDAMLARLKELRRLPGPLGVNIGANKDSADRIADYAEGARRMHPFADYLTVNVSSPNTPGLRALQDRAALYDLLAAVQEASGRSVPIFLKVAPDLQPADIDDIVTVSVDRNICGLIVSNTTISRPSLQSPHAGESGGLSGRPLRELASQRLEEFARASAGRLILVAAGGISSAEDAYARIRAGASLIQLYSGLVYHGPGLARRIAEGLDRLLARDGVRNVTEIVGQTAHRG